MNSTIDLDTILKGKWFEAACIDRGFVRQKNPERSPGTFWRGGPDFLDPVVTLIIPTSDAVRGGYLRRLLAQINEQRFTKYEVIIIKGDPRQGRAINTGASLACGKYLITFDDDTSLPDPDTLSKLVDIMENNPDIGIAGGNAVIPHDAPALVKAALRQIPRRAWEPVREIVDSDLAQHPCLIMRTDEFRAVGGENELIPRGLDPYLREEFRKIGKRVVLVPDVFYHHLVPSTLRELVRQFHRNGVQAAFVNRHFPQWVIETPSTHGTFKARVPLPWRILRFGARQAVTMARGHWIRLFCEASYGAGFIAGWFRFRKRGRRDFSRGSN